MDYQMRVTSSHTCPMDRQCTEQVDIAYFDGPVLMNRRTELGGVRVERQRYKRWGTNMRERERERDLFVMGYYTG